MTVLRLDRNGSVRAAARALAIGLFAAGCAPAASGGPTAVTPLAAGQARVWFYRDYEPSESRNFATVTLSGGAPIYVRPDGSSTYRDVSAGRYVIAVQSYIANGHQAQTVALAPGSETYVKVLSLGSWIESGDMSSFRRDTLEVSLVPPHIAQSEMPAHPLAGI